MRYIDGTNYGERKSSAKTTIILLNCGMLKCGANFPNKIILQLVGIFCHDLFRSVLGPMILSDLAEDAPAAALVMMIGRYNHESFEGDSERLSWYSMHHALPLQFSLNGQHRTTDRKGVTLFCKV